jgi:hemolysin activation/secretion protein
MNSDRFLLKRSALGLLCLALMSGATFAQTRADIDAANRQAEIIQRQEQERLRLDQQRMHPADRPPGGIDTQALMPKPDASAAGTICREIKLITINGAPLLPQSVRASIEEKFQNRCLGVAEIEQILGDITLSYMQRGYVTTRAYLPAQDMSTGRLEIMVMEGVIEKFMFDDGDKKSIRAGTVFPGLIGEVLNIRDLEQGIDQINRLSSNNAQLDIQPGEKPGDSTVVVKNQPKSPFHLNVSADNQGAYATGRNQYGLTLGADNLLNLNEMISATHRESQPNSLDRQYSGSDSINVSVPLGYTTFSVGHSRSRYVSMIQMPSGLELRSSGNNTTNYFKIDRVIYRGQSGRASLAATITTKAAKNYLNDQFLAVSSRNLTVLDLDSSVNTAFLGGVLNLDIGYARGLKSMGALQDASSLPPEAPRAQGEKFKFGFNYAQPFSVFGKDASFTSQMTLQKAPHTLYGSEQIAIGGLYSVRGFIRNTLSGDNGYYWRNELSLKQPVSLGSETLAARFFVGHDSGRVQNITPNIPNGSMTGMALGVAVNYLGGSWEFFNTRPLTLQTAMTKESSSTWFRLSAGF